MAARSLAHLVNNLARKAVYMAHAGTSAQRCVFYAPKPDRSLIVSIKTLRSIVRYQALVYHALNLASSLLLVELIHVKGFVERSVLKCIFPVQVLDEKFEMAKIYRMNGSEVLAVDLKSKPNRSLLNCPSCSASIAGVRRYALLDQIHDLNNLLGSLCSPLGRQLWRIMKFVNHEVDDVFNNFDKLCQNIKPGPLMVKNNRDIVLRKLTRIRGALTEVERVRDTQVDSVQTAVLKFTAFLGTLPNLSTGQAGSDGTGPALGIPNLSYRLRSERIVIRCKFVIAKFLWDMYKRIRRQKNPDSHLSLFQEVIRKEAIAEVQGILDKLDVLMIQCEAGNFKRLEVEFIIQKVLLVSLMGQMDVGVKNGAMIDLIQHGVDICRESKSARLLYTNLQTSRTCILSSTYYFNVDDAQEVPKQPNANIQILWKRLGLFERGSLRMCPSGHYRCSSSFKYCPECE